MNPCRDWKEKIIAYLDDETGDHDRKRVSDHLKACSACRTFHDKSIRIKEEYIHVQEPETSATLKQDILSEVRTDEQNYVKSYSFKKNSRELHLERTRWIWFLSAAALLLLTASWTIASLLVRENRTLKQDLQNARQDLELAHQQIQITKVKVTENQTISDLNTRVYELEKQVKHGISHWMVRYTESPYYEPDRPGSM